MFTLSVEKMISAAHQLLDYDGPCANVHGHNWKVKVEVQSNKVDDIGIVMDFARLDEKLWTVIGRYDHQLINAIPPFDKLNPTAENLVKYIYDQMKNIMEEQVIIKNVSLWETDEFMVSYAE